MSWNKGKKGIYSKKTIELMRLAKLGKPSFLKGKKLSQEHIEKLRVSHLGQVAWNKNIPFNDVVRKKMSDARLCKPRPGNPENWKHTQETKLKMISSNLGKGHPGLKGILHPRYIKDRGQLRKSDDRRKDYANREWNKLVRIRDNNKCRIFDESCCGRIEVHHILNWIDFPEQRYNINNGITLCSRHHPKGRKKEDELSPYFQSLIINNK